MSESKKRKYNGEGKAKKKLKTLEENFATLREEIKKLASNSDFKVRLIVDTKEKQEVKDIMISVAGAKNSELGGIVEIAPLNSGDFIIMIGDKIFLLFERKRLQDYDSSIKDGRMGSQGLKMDLMPVDPHRTFYLLETSVSLSSEEMEDLGISRMSVVGKITSLHVRKKRITIHTSDLYDTALRMLYYVKWAYEYGHEYKSDLDSYPSFDIGYDPLKVDISTIEKVLPHLRVASERKKNLDSPASSSPPSTSTSSSPPSTSNLSSLSTSPSTSSPSSTLSSSSSPSSTLSSSSTSPPPKPKNKKDDDSDSKETSDDDSESKEVKTSKSESSGISSLEQKYVATKKKKVKNIDNPDTYYSFCLSGIPRMGQKNSAISRAYPEPIDLICFINNINIDGVSNFKKKTKKEIIDTLANLELTSCNMGKKASDAKKRKQTRVGPDIAKKLYDNYVRRRGKANSNDDGEDDSD